MSRRRSIGAADIPEHKNPIPAAAVVGNLLFSSAIIGKDPQSHALPDDKQAQIANVFAIMRAILREAGASAEDIGRLSVYLRDKADRELVNPYWEEMFPDAASRPARHTTTAALPPGQHIQAEFIAVLDQGDRN
jgi:2-iminobutanoate/2-iminopropanoate deaminase